MLKTANIENEKSWCKAFVSVLWGMGATFFCFGILSFISLILVHFVVCDLGEQGCCLFEHNVWQFSSLSETLWKAYANWFEVLIQGIKNRHFNLLLLFPIAVPFISILVLLWVLLKSSVSLRWWYVLNHHFAKGDDVFKMGLINANLVMLGRFGNEILGVPEPSSVLCVGETGSGKTSTVAVPSILQADEMCVLAVDNSGTLARHSSGHRATIGKVFYFNWDVCDNKDKGLLYPRFNLLDPQNVPEEKNAKGEYIRFLAEYLVNTEDEDSDNYWVWQAISILEALINFVMIKCQQAEANDYFLSTILEKTRLSREDKDILLSYYLLMPEAYRQKALDYVNKEILGAEDYIPIGSWGGLPNEWQGKSLCMGMVADWLIGCYLNEKDVDGDWYKWIENLLLEATLFNYGENTIKGLQQFLYLSKQQRKMVFASMVRPLKMFLNHNIRERTTGNDFRISDLSGRYNNITKQWEPITIYAVANTKTTKFVNRMMVDFLLKYSVLERNDNSKYPALMVFDDVGQMLKVKSLPESVIRGPKKGVSFLLLCNSFNNMENTYGKDVLEVLVANTRYKMIMAENSIKMSRQLDKMAIFASRSVQLPKDGRRIFSAKPYFADTSYYHRLAIELKGQNNKKLQTKGYQLVLVEGYYHRPVLTKNKSFMQDDLFKDKAALGVAYFLDDNLIKERNIQDFVVPKCEDVLYEEEQGIEDLIDLDNYINVVFEEGQKYFSEDAKIETIMINDISAKWKRIKKVEDNDNWWLAEDAFETKENLAKDNPFVNKK